MGNCLEPSGTTIKQTVKTLNGDDVEVRVTVNNEKRSILVGQRGTYAEYHSVKSADELKKMNTAVIGTAALDEKVDTLVDIAKTLAAMSK